MPIGSSPFLTADVDESLNFNAQGVPERTRPTRGDILSARLELIRRRVLTGYYSTPVVAENVARRLVDLDLSTG
jgi:hypothetical protein